MKSGESWVSDRFGDDWRRRFDESWISIHQNKRIVVSVSNQESSGSLDQCFIFMLQLVCIIAWPTVLIDTNKIEQEKIEQIDIGYLLEEWGSRGSSVLILC